MTRSEKLPLSEISSKSDYVVYSRRDGVVSGHRTATEAIKAFTTLASRNLETDAAIYKRERDGWELF